jgi:signal peptidase II
LVVSFSLLFYSSRHPKRQAVGRRFAHSVIWLPIGLLLGGAIGNLINRVSQGSVTDFINLKGSGLAFNLADLALITGSILMLWLISARSPGQASVNSGLSP